MTFFLQILLQLLPEILITLEDSKLTPENKSTFYNEAKEKRRRVSSSQQEERQKQLEY